jgi:hypothetical protein
LEPGILDCRFPWKFSNINLSWCREQRERRRVSSCLISRFYGHDTIIYTSEHCFQ